MYICDIILHTNFKGGIFMIVDIDMNRKQEIINARKELYKRLELANQDKYAIDDYLDFFDTRCVPLAIKCLPKKQKKQYEGMQRQLMAGLGSLKARVGEDERKMYAQMNICAHRFNRFVKLAYLGEMVYSREPLEQLYNAEFSSTIARLVYTAVEPKYMKKYHLEYESEQ